MKVFTKPKVTIVKFSDAVEMGISTTPSYEGLNNTQTFKTSEKIQIKRYDFFE
ncbi:MAG: hypothetical protein ACI4RS_04215 [Monoglobaceae bacterium]